MLLKGHVDLLGKMPVVTSPRKLAWIEGPLTGTWGCSRCSWVFGPFDWIPGKSIDEMATALRRELIGQFAAHKCR